MDCGPVRIDARAAIEVAQMIHEMSDGGLQGRYAFGIRHVQEVGCMERPVFYSLECVPMQVVAHVRVLFPGVCKLNRQGVRVDVRKVTVLKSWI